MLSPRSQTRQILHPTSCVVGPDLVEEPVPRKPSQRLNAVLQPAEEPKVEEPEPPRLPFLNSVAPRELVDLSPIKSEIGSMKDQQASCKAVETIGDAKNRHCSNGGDHSADADRTNARTDACKVHGKVASRSVPLGDRRWRSE